MYNVLDRNHSYKRVILVTTHYTRAPVPLVINVLYNILIYHLPLITQFCIISSSKFNAIRTVPAFLTQYFPLPVFQNLESCWLTLKCLSTCFLVLYSNAKDLLSWAAISGDLHSLFFYFFYFFIIIVLACLCLVLFLFTCQLPVLPYFSTFFLLLGFLNSPFNKLCFFLKLLAWPAFRSYLLQLGQFLPVVSVFFFYVQ